MYFALYIDLIEIIACFDDQNADSEYLDFDRHWASVDPRGIEWIVYVHTDYIYVSTTVSRMLQLLVNTHHEQLQIVGKIYVTRITAIECYHILLQRWTTNS